MRSETKIIDIRQARQLRRRRYLAAYGDRLNTLIEEFIEANLPFDIADLTQIYVNALQQDESSSWCHLEFRELVSRAIQHCLGDELMITLGAEPWFNRAYVSLEEVIDRSTTYFILRKGRVANN